jgi:RNA polymerase sigma factor (sigma-70 family)
VFLNAHRSLEQGVEPQSEQAWLYKIAEHVVMYRRRTIARRARVEFPIDMNVVADLVASPGQHGDPEPNGLSEALARLPEAERRAIVLREWCGLSYREVAAEIGVSTSAAEKLIVRARRRLAEELGGPQPTLRRRALSILSPLTSLKWFLGGGTTLKALVGATSIAVLAVGSGRVVLQRQHAASPAASAAPHAVLGMRAGASAPRRHAVAARLRAKVPAVAARPATPEPAAVRAAAPAVPDSELTAGPEEPVATVAPEEQADREVTADPPAASGEATTAAPDLAPVEDASEVVTTPPAESSVAPDVSGLQVLATETDAPAAEQAQPGEPDPAAGAGPPSGGGPPGLADGGPPGLVSGEPPGLAADGPPGLAGGDPPGQAVAGPPGLTGGDPPGQAVGGPPAVLPEPPRHEPGEESQDESGRGPAQRLEHNRVDLFAVVNPILEIFDARPGVERGVAEAPEAFGHLGA